MRTRWLAFRDLLQRYAQVFRSVWKIRHELASPQRQRQELEFLPAHLELAETPVHPAPKWAARLILLFAAIALLWATFGQVNIVTTAQGKLVPRGQVKIVQSMDTGIVRAILVHDGQRVHAGQPLIELDTTQAGADVDKAQTTLHDAELTAARVRALLSAQSHQRLPRVAVVAGADPVVQAEQQHLADAQYAEFQEKLASQRAELLHRQDQLLAARETVDHLEKTAPLAAQVAQSYSELVKNNYVARKNYLQKEQDSINLAGELAAQRSQAQALQAAITQQRRTIASTVAQFRHQQLAQLAKAQQQILQSGQDLTKADQRKSRLVLRAPVDGTVQQLSVYTVGGVVSQAKPLMKVVPDNTLEVEAQVKNKNIGFVHVGQIAAVKLQTFPFTRYGYLHGVVRLVSNDAKVSKSQGLLFPVRIRLKTNRMWVDGHWVRLLPGMAVTADIKTGRRSVAQYFLSPLLQTSEDSLHER
jgi:hemolysin D